MGQESGYNLSWVLWLRVSHKVAVKLSAGPQSSRGSVGEGSAANPAHEVVNSIQFFRSEGLSSALAIGRRLPSVPCLSTGQLRT